MFPRRPARLRFVTWLVALAILFGSLAPSLALAVQDEQGGRWSEICTALGVKTIRIADAGAVDADVDVPGASGKHCLYCQLNAGPALPPADTICVFTAQEVQRSPRLFYLSARPLFTWASANPRAPPFLS